MNLIEIDWANKWSLMQTATYYQATMLSLNIDPRNAHFAVISSNLFDIQFNPNGDFSPDIKEQATVRYWVIKDNALKNKFFISHEELDFEIFALWAKTIKLPLIPKELEEIGRRQELKLNNSKATSSLKEWFDGLKESHSIEPIPSNNRPIEESINENIESNSIKPKHKKGTRWTQEELNILIDYQKNNGTPKTAKYFDVSEQLVRSKIKPKAKKEKGESVFTHHLK